MKTLANKAKRTSCEGMTLIEVVIAMVLSVFVAGSIYAAGISVLRLSQTNRIMTEAHAFTKEGIESILAAGYDAFRGGHVPAQTNLVDTATHRVEIVRTTETIWHRPDGSVLTGANGVDNGYAEITVTSSFRAPGTTKRTGSSLSAVLMDMKNE